MTEGRSGADSTAHSTMPIALLMAAVATYGLFYVMNAGVNIFEDPDSCIYCGGDGVIVKITLAGMTYDAWCPFVYTQPWLHHDVPLFEI